jgi:DNA-binding PadR family transcriptional regulator
MLIKEGNVIMCPVDELAMSRVFIFMLWFIGKGHVHGYEIIKTLKANGMKGVSPAKVYTLLSMMKAKGLVSLENIPHGKRIKKVYTVTAKGRVFLKNGKKNLFSGIFKKFVLKMIK